jgi:hypothetical protein
LEGFWPHPCRFCKRRGPNPDCQKHRTPQGDFLAALTKMVAAFAGNQFGKTTALVVKLLVQHVPSSCSRAFEAVQVHAVRRADHGQAVRPFGEGADRVHDPGVQAVVPKELFLGGSWDKAWDKQHNILRFSNDLGQVGIYTYQQDPATMVGAACTTRAMTSRRRRRSATRR